MKVTKFTKCNADGDCSFSIWWMDLVYASVADDMTRFSVVHSVQIGPLILSEGTVVNDDGVLLS